MKDLNSDVVPLSKILPETLPLLMGAGPVPVPKEVAEANTLVINHLGETMNKVVNGIVEMSQYVFQTDLRQWNVNSWYSQIQDVTITTIVPTQLYDLVQKNLRAPEKLKYIIVGGDLLSSELKKEALKLGWPVIRTFGMSEVCSQLASAKKPESDDMEILPIHSVKIEDDRLLVKSEALFTLEFTIGKELLVTEAPKDYYVTKDRAEIKGNIIRHLGRVGDDYKIAGHLVNLNILRDQLSTYLVRTDLYNQMEFSIQDDERKGKKLVLLSLNHVNQNSLSEIARLISPVKIDEVKVVPNFERTALGKLKKT